MTEVNNSTIFIILFYHSLNNLLRLLDKNKSTFILLFYMKNIPIKKVFILSQVIIEYCYQTN